MRNSTLQAFLFAAAITGCTGQGDVRYSAQAEVATPQLVEVEPGVQVVEDYDQPVFYSEGFYWRVEGNTWYRSPYHNRAWVHVETVPVAVRRIDRPERYRRYHGQGNVEVRDHREPAPPPPTVVAPPPPQPEVRDHRSEAEERHDERREEKHEEKAVKQDNREVAHDKKEMAHDQKELQHDRAEIDRDKAHGDAKEEKRDKKELERDKNEQSRDKHELDKDQKRREKDKH